MIFFLFRKAQAYDQLNHSRIFQQLFFVIYRLNKVIDTIAIVLIHLTSKSFYKNFFFQVIFLFLSRTTRVYDLLGYILIFLQFFFGVPLYLYLQIQLFRRCLYLLDDCDHH